MENNTEIMNEEINVMNDEIVAEGGSGIATGVAMAIGAGLVCAVGAGFKLAKKGIAAYKEHKKLKKPEKEIEVDHEEVVTVAEPEA